MFSVDTRIDHQPARRSLRRAVVAAWCGAVLSLVSAALVPACLWLAPLGLLAFVAYALVLGRRHRALLAEFAELGKKRGFAFAAGVVPTRPAPRTTSGVAAVDWTAEWVPFAMAKIADDYQGAAVTAWRKQPVGGAAAEALAAAQLRWLRTHLPARWTVVAGWWQRWFVAPLLERRHGAQPPTAAQRDAAAAALELELRIGVAIAGQPALWARQLGFGDESAAYAELGRRLATVDEGGRPALPPFPRQAMSRPSELFIGRGFLWDAEHTQRIEDLKLRNIAEVTSDPAEQGDPRIYGIGHRQAGDLFMDEPQFNQMAGIFGSTGVGKTRYAEALLVQVVRSGLPLLVIDPKGDQALTNRLLEECRLNGRGHQFRYFCLAAPQDQRTWSYLARYNPCSSYTDPAELAARIAAVLPSTKDPFWTNVAKSMLETCMTLVHWTGWYLRFLSREPDGTLPPRASREVPRVLLAMQWARHHPQATPAQAGAAIDAIRARLQDPGWTPSGADERDVVELATTRSLAAVPIYAPCEWIPTVRHVNEYEIDNTVAFLGWMLKIFHFHLYLAGARTAAPACPRTAAPAEITAKGGRGGEEASLWAAYQGSRYHPLELRYEPNADLPPEQRRWRAFYDHFVPERDGDAYELQRMFAAVRMSLESHYSDATKERQKFLEYATTLQSAIKPFLGERARIMCAVDSDLAWDAMIAERQVVYCALSSMIDDHGATACAKMIVQDIAAYFGRRYQYAGGKADPVYIFADEVSSFINEPFIQLLNKCRGVGLRAIIAGQTRADLARQLGKEGAQQVMGNLNTVIQLRSPLDEDAREFAGRAGDARIIQESRSVSTTPAVGHTGLTDVRGFTANESRSYQQQTVKRIPPEAVLALPRGQAFVHAKGQVWLLAQGMFPDPTTDLYEEIGMHRGVMREAVRPVQRRRPGREPAAAAPADADAPVDDGLNAMAAQAPEPAAPPALFAAAPDLALRDAAHGDGR